MSARYSYNAAEGTSHLVDIPEDELESLRDAHRDAVERVLSDEPEQIATVLAARLAVVDKVRASELDDDTTAQLVGIFPPWEVGIDVKVRDVYSWDGTLVECIQAHTTQADWTPDATPTLWKLHRTDDGDTPLAWLPGLELTLDDQVTYDGVLYDVIQAHTTQEGWEPPATPALFEPAV